LDDLEHNFRFNDAILRHLTVKMNKAETTPSIMLKAVEKSAEREERKPAEVAVEAAPAAAAE
jgi:small subunit ribosomal protein S6